MKKLFSLFVAIAVTTAIWASNTITYTATEKLSGYNGSLDVGKTTFGPAITSHTFSNGQGTITCSGEVTTIGAHAFQYCEGLTSITIPNSVTTIGSSAFFNCSGLTSVTIPNSVTTIGSSAFFNCSGLTSPVYNVNCFVYMPPSYQGAYTIPDGIQQIGSPAFYNCTGLTSVTIPNSVTTIGNSAFEYCRGLTSVTIPNSVTTIGNSAFYDCDGLTSVTIPNSVTTIGNYAFEYCTALKTVYNNSNLNITKGSKDYGYVAYYADNVYNGIPVGDFIIKQDTILGGYVGNATDIIIPNSVTTIGSYAFSGCSGLTSVTIPNSVTMIGNNAFSGCSGLTKTNYTGTIAAWCKIKFDGNNANPMSYSHNFFINDVEVKDLVIPESVTTIGNYAFNSCSGLTSVTIGNSVTTIGSSAFAYCSGLTSVTIGNSVTTIGNYAFNSCSGLTSVTIPNSVTTIGDRAFFNCSGLTSVTINSNAICSKTYTSSSNIGNIFGSQVKEYIIGNSVTTIGENAFYSCSGLTSVTIGNSVTTIGDYAFWDCSGLTSVTIGNSVTTIGDRAFLGCSGLTSVTIGNSVTTIGNYAFNSCSGLTSVTIGNSVTTIGSSAFAYCSGLTSVTIGNSVTTIGNYAFNSCSGLTSVTIPNSVTTIGDRAFFNCSGLTSVTIPNSVTTIGNNAFSGCSGLTSVTINSNAICSKTYTLSSNIGNIFGSQVKEYIIGNSVTTIGNYAFYYCKGLTSVTIGNSVTTIGDDAFDSCSGLTKTNYMGTIADWCKIKFGNYDANPMYYSHNFFINDVEVKDLVIPEGVEAIGNSAFYGCSGLKTVTCYATNPPTCGSDCFYNVGKSIPVYVPARSVNAYKQANSWKDFKNIQGFPNDYAIVTCSATNGTIKGGGKYIKGDTCTLTVTPSYGYHFTQWNDGNTDNPRSFVVTQDTTFIAELAINIYSFDVQTADSIMGSVVGTKGNYEHGTSLDVSAQPNYGYHFDHWSDGNKQNPRTFTLTKDTVLTAYFAKNIYSVSASKSQYGSIFGTGKYNYLDTCTLTVIPDFGYNFIGWNDGNTANPRSLVVTHDTTFTAQFEQQSTIMGRCGDDLAWNLHNGVLTITGSGDMYDSNYDSWSRWADQITTINLPEGLTHIGQYAFANCVNVTRIDLPASVTSIGCGAFYNDYSIEEITCPTSAVPTVDCDETFYKVSQYVYVYVISDLVRKYQINQYWQKFDIRVLGAEEKPITDDEVIVTPSTDNATIVWPANDDAAEYTLEITKDGVVFCTLRFNAQGQLIGIAFAPNRDGELRTMSNAEMTATGWSFTVTGLNPGSTYSYTVDVIDAQKQSIRQYTGSFTTTGGVVTSLPTLTSTSASGKMLYNGHLYILRDGNLFTATGARVK